MSPYWANIIKKGDPNAPGLPEWPAYSAPVIELGDNFRPIPVSSPERADFWKRFYATQPAW